MDSTQNRNGDYFKDTLGNFDLEQYQLKYDHFPKGSDNRLTEGFRPQIHFTPLVSQLGGQVGYLKKQNSSRNSIV